MKLSIVIPVYNGAEFIDKSYKCVVDQNLKDWEILYIDNNSKDASIEKVKILIDQDSRVTLFTQPIQGAAAARNKGIENAKGDYVYVFDVDDEIYPDALNKMIGVLDAYPKVDAVFGKMVKSNQSIEQTLKPNDETHSVIFKDAPYWGIHWFSSLRNVVGPPAFLYRKAVFNNIGVYNENLKNDEDTALDIKLGMTSNVAFLDTYVYLYFKHQNSTIQQTKKSGGMLFHTWRRLIHEHLEFYWNHKVPFEFKKILFRQIFSSMGKLIYYTPGYLNRKQQLKQLLEDVKPVWVPFYIKLYLNLLVFLPLKQLLKFYTFYLSRWYVDKFLRKS